MLLKLEDGRNGRDVLETLSVCHLPEARPLQLSRTFVFASGKKKWLGEKETVSIIPESYARQQAQLFLSPPWTGNVSLVHNLLPRSRAQPLTGKMHTAW